MKSIAVNLPAWARIAALLIISAGACLGEGANPGHLEPISPYDRIGYGRTVFEALIGKRPAELWMICLPSIRPEWAVMLRSESADSKAETLPDSKPDARPDQKPEAIPEGEEKRRWYLEIAVPAQQVSELRKNAKLDRRRIEIDETAAKTLREAWAAVTRQTRYPDTNEGAFDGVTYQFYSKRQFGETWSPATGLPARLVELGTRLLKCVQGPAEGRDAPLEEALGVAKDIKARADVSAGKRGGESALPAK